MKEGREKGTRIKERNREWSIHRTGIGIGEKKRKRN